jgi:hypothetical protein
MENYRNDACAKCKIRTDFPEQMKKNRKGVSSLWMRQAIYALNQSPWRSNDFVCRPCYDFLLNNYKNYSIEQLQNIENIILNTIQNVETYQHIEVDNEEVKCDNYPLLFDNITSERCKILTGITIDQLNLLVIQFQNNIPPVRNISFKNCIGFYLMKMKLGISTHELGSLYNVPSYNQIRKIIDYIRKLFFEHFTPFNLGTRSITRENIISNHTTIMSKILLNAKKEAVISIWDATYIYIEKSANYDYQRSTFSMHKHRNLLKFMILCATDGHIIDVIGPYLCNGSNNDASITQNIFENNVDDIYNWFQEDDLFVVDRGFRDVLSYLETNKYETRMPCFLAGKQHTTFNANYSRLVTKIRWVIESVNARIKKYKYFANILINQNIPTIEYDFKNISAIINKFRPQLASTDDEESEEDFRNMVIISQKEDPFVEKCKMFKKRILSKKKKFNPHEIAFPRLTEEHLEFLAKGVYQLKQAKSYTAEHLDENGNYLFEIYEEEQESIIHVKLRSRFSSQTIHDLWIKYDSKLTLQEGQQPIISKYCTCQQGARTFGICAHVTSVLWFLGIARFDEKLISKRKCDLFSTLCRNCD